MQIKQDFNKIRIRRLIFSLQRSPAKFGRTSLAIIDDTVLRIAYNGEIYLHQISPIK